MQNQHKADCPCLQHMQTFSKNITLMVYLKKLRDFVYLFVS